MFIRTLLLIPLLFARMLLDGEGAAGDAGAAGGAGDGDAGKGGDNKGDATPPPANGGTSSDTGAGAGGTGAGGAPQVDPAITRANQQAASERVKAKEATDKLTAMQKAIIPFLKSLGMQVPEGAEADPEQLSKEVETWKGKYRETRVNSSIEKAAAAEGAKPELTLRYLRGGGELAALDPDDPGFDEAAKAVVQAAIAKEPTLKSAQAAPGRSGGDFSAGANGATQSIEQRIKEATDKGDFKTVIRLQEEYAAAKAGAAPAGSVN